MGLLKNLLVVATMLALSVDRSAGQISIPSRSVGFVYDQLPEVPNVEIAAYLDATCGDSAAVYPTLLQIAEFYHNDRVQFRMHLHNLPYHANSHPIAKAAHVLEDFAPNNNTAFKWISLIF
ncbi:hypothetical protein EGW08_019751, partial [Elysia chlorotica]